MEEGTHVTLLCSPAGYRYNSLLLSRKNCKGLDPMEQTMANDDCNLVIVFFESKSHRFIIFFL